MCIKFKVYRWVLIVLIACCMIHEVHTFCSLEKMKKYAMEACEHLFQQDEPRNRRSLDGNHHHKNQFGYNKQHARHEIRRSNYPKGGYLKVNFDHFRRLSELDVLPRYKPSYRKMHHEKERYKRNLSSSYDNIPYCCFNSCEENFFC